MRSLVQRLMIAGSVGLLMSSFQNGALAVGVLYSDPGWLYAFDGDSAYYHDPDGYHPDYINGTDNNAPGGQTGEPALIDVGTACEPNCESIAIWQNSGSQWDGSAPGDPLGGDAVYNQLVPPNPPAAPGGVGAFSDGSTTFIRIQDAGQPQPYGWADKGAQLGPGTPKQEGNNRRIQFQHKMDRVAGFSGTTAIIDDGVTIAFRARIATAATGPLDDIYNEDGPTSSPWPTDGVGYPVGNNGRGMIMLSQTSTSGPGQMAFSLMDNNAIAANGLSVSKTGLVMNNASGGPDTNESTPTTLNVFEIDNSELTDWREFWITVQKLPAPIGGSTHEVNVYFDGSLEPETFNIVLGLENEFGNGSHLGLGLSSGSRWGAFDLDYIAYREGVHVPTPGGTPGDYNGDGAVDAADYVVWRKNAGTSNVLSNDNIGGVIGAEHYNQWRENFGETSGGGAGFNASVIPEPTSALLAILAFAFVGCPHTLRRR